MTTASREIGPEPSPSARTRALFAQPQMPEVEREQGPTSQWRSSQLNPGPDLTSEPHTAEVERVGIVVEGRVQPRSGARSSA